jgi:hypothetical protein
MRLLVEYADGFLEPAILTAWFGDNLRVFLPGYDDVVSFRRVGSHWRTDAGDAVEIHVNAPPAEFFSCLDMTSGIEPSLELPLFWTESTVPGRHEAPASIVN